jgi:tRNA-splicing ligase RtcB
MSEEIRLRRIDDWTWEIPRSGEMRVPARIYASESLLSVIRGDMTLRQARNVACLPGILEAAYVMPDAHQGYGFPIGGVAAFDMGEGIVSPGGVGYDINCGVRLMATGLDYGQVRGSMRELLDAIRSLVPAGVGKGGATSLGKDDLLRVCARGAEWAVENGLGREEDLAATEEAGRMAEASTGELSQRALDRGLPQLGTLGGGNHFLEIQRVDEVFDGKAADAFGLPEPGQVTVMIHCGSRGFGHQVASDFIRRMEDELGSAGLPDRELINSPLGSPLGRAYYGAMCAAVNYAFANRQIIAARVREAFDKVLGRGREMRQVWDVCHNVAKMETHTVAGQRRRVCIHRKGATRSFGPGREEVPEACRDVGQPVIIPGSMGTASYLLAGTEESEAASFGSAAHGAGRVMSRNRARKRFPAKKIRGELRSMGIELAAASRKGVSEEASGAYKDIEEVVRVSRGAGLGRPVARLLPCGVIKG